MADGQQISSAIGISINLECQHPMEQPHSIASSLITVRNSNLGKVMISQACVKNSVHVRGWGWGLGETAIAADGTLPTGMHSCFINIH